MKKKYLFLLLIGIIGSLTYVLANGTAVPTELSRPSSLQEQVKQKPKMSVKKHPVNRPKVYQPKLMYGFLIYDDYLDLGFVSFNLNDLSSLSLVDEENFDYVNSNNVTAGAFADGSYYYWNANEDMQSIEFCKYDFTNKKKTSLSNYYEDNVQVIKARDMSYDYSTQAMYALVEYSKDNYYDQFLARVELTKGKAIDSIRMDPCYALASSYDGKLYGITTLGNLVEISKETGKQKVVVETGIYIDTRNRQSMEFDHTDGSLYWACYTEKHEGRLIRFNLEDHTFADLGTLGGNAQMVGLYIPFVRNNLDSPDQATGLSVVADAQGKAEADISWVNPGVTLNGDPLTSISKVELFRNDVLIKTFATVTPGGEMSFHDTNVPNGYNNYKIVAHNDIGEGIPATCISFVGHDVPEAVINPALTKINDTTAKIIWEAPRTGSAGGWISSDITYNIVRMPDSILIKKSLAATEYIDDNLVDLKTYYYRIEPETMDGKGIFAETNHVLIGEACLLPYQSYFGEPDESNLWTVIDANGDGRKWEFQTSSIFFGKGVAVGYTGRGSDEWLISSPIRLENEKAYELFLDGRLFREDSIRIEITIGKGITAEDQNITVRQYWITSSKGWSTMKMKLPKMPAGDYNVGIHLTDTRGEDEIPFTLQVSNFRMTTTVASSVRGIIKYRNEPEEGVLVGVRQGEENITSVKTNKEGRYDIPYLLPGTYKLIVSKTKYATIEEEITLQEDEDIDKNFILTSLELYKLQGKVLDTRNNPVGEAEIRLDGYHRYKTFTKEDGSFEIANIYEGDNYKLSVYKSKCEQISRDINIREDMVLDDVKLSDALLLPEEVSAKVNVDNSIAVVEWQEPVANKTYRYDDGKTIGVRGWTSSSYVGVFGVVYRQPADLNKLSWFTVEDGYRDHDNLDVFIFDLDENGNPVADKILYYKQDVANIPGQWIVHELVEAVHCPNGFYVALSCEGFLSLGCDDGEGEDYPFRKGTVCASSDYENESLFYVEEQQNDYANNLMLRAEGVPIGSTYERKSIAGTQSAKVRIFSKEKGVATGGNRIVFRPLTAPLSTEETGEEKVVAVDNYHPSYNVYRFKEIDEEVVENWTLLTLEPTDLLTYADHSFGTLEKGFYKYAVKAVYTNNRISEPGLSDKVGKDVYSMVSLTISTNVEGVNGEGAYVELKNSDNTYSGKADVSGTLIFANILKGNYKLSVCLPNHEDYVADVDYSQNNEYGTTVLLKEKVSTPTNLEVRATDQNDECLFTWNGFDIYDDFESYNDFSINPEGEIAWSYVDGDDVHTLILATSASDIVYPGVGDKMAYIVFNPYKTKPSLANTDLLPYSGDKFLACIAAMRPYANDDYIISPEIPNTADDFYLTFQAKSYGASGKGCDKMRVGYSFYSKELTDFNWLTEEPVDVAGEWTHYSYKIPAGARYVTINCVSQGQLVFMLDDIYIGSLPEHMPKASKTVGVKAGGHSYEVYLDGEKIATQSENTYLFTKLTEGKHKAGVKAVYTTGASELVEIEFNVLTGITNAADDLLMIYPNPAKERLYIRGDYDYVKIYNLTGSVVGIYEPGGYLDISQLVDGVYMVELQNGDQAKVVKLVVGE